MVPISTDPTQLATSSRGDCQHVLEKKSLRAAEQDLPDLKEARQAWRSEFDGTDPSRLVFLDGSGATNAMTRRHSRSLRSRRVDAAVPHGHWKVVTLTAAVRLDGVGACLAFDGATNTACFQTYLENRLVPTLKPGDTVVMDNQSRHKTAEGARLIAGAGAEIRYLPAYSPDLNPIERMFSKLKEFLRSAEARRVGDLIAAMGEGLRLVTPGNILEWFDHSGYRQGQ